MGIKIAINGFGRIGRLALRIGMNNPELDIVAINDITDAKTLAHLFKYDSVHGKADAEVRAEGGKIVVNDRAIDVYAVRSPEELPWKKYGVDVVLECTGIFRTREKAKGHITAGAKKVILSAPGKDDTPMFVLGVNEEKYAGEKILSNASCTTNCLAPPVKVLHEKCGIQYGFMTTIHSYTADQRILDSPHRDFRRARAAAVSMVPTTTGAAKAIGEVIPDLSGKLDGLAVRVPTPNVSLVDLVATVKNPVPAEEINDAFRKAAAGPMKGILAVSDEPLVSCDYMGNMVSSIVDAEFTKVLDNIVKTLAWYDNEAGYAARMVDLAQYIMK